MSSIKLGWSFILSLPELNQHLPKPDLLNNGQVSSYIRAKLRPLIFKTININKDVELIPEDISHEGTLDEKYAALNSEFSHIQKLVKRTELNLNTDPILTSVIVNYFENIDSLTINEAIMPHTTFKIIFNSLKKLKKLNIYNCVLLFHPLANEVEDIYLNENLTVLYLTYTGGISTSLFENIKAFMRIDSDEESGVFAVNLRFSTNFLNLKKLRFLRGNMRDIISLESFILENNRLEAIEIYIDQLNSQLFNLLAIRCKNLKSVRIYPTSEGSHQSLELKNYSTLPSVKTLNLFKLYSYENELSYLLAPFPNISHLIISNTHPLSSPVFDYIQNLKELTKLTIYLGESDENIYNSNLISNTITSLEFKKFESLKLWKFDLLENFPNLNKISIDVKSFSESELDNLKAQLKNAAGWRVIEFQESINCYKLK
ncbi:hypothetical protein CONCODRAFT_12543 [Conidiobolus coronatus NRRL 28638]|uniref:RNI-like protein n=1 Tax=Conidiobolus coronatus (strain ATCC 28846 / CBS 209.66 / NRRL 28638) TaxID=796925 RepID=A0A137NSU5_CONC2|nr:hypothetical protein CONCODRAFT_12543 [Conidiobolus coronatus NRRL 28638]|eukprot:KXN65774.1 hypothetical protein CONCODRAFT_12543 [Conidiobolus coronatus NRRL 28638]